MQIVNVELKDMDAWRDFVEANEEAILERYESIGVAYRYAWDGGLEIGGGAAPLFIVTFELSFDALVAQRV